MAKNKLDALYPQRELKFPCGDSGQLTVLVKAAPGLYAAELVDACDTALDKFKNKDVSALVPEVWPRIKKIVAQCVIFDDPEITDTSEFVLEKLPLKVLSEIVSTVKDLTMDVGDDVPFAFERATGLVFGVKFLIKPKVDEMSEISQKESETTSQTSA